MIDTLFTHYNKVAKTIERCMKNHYQYNNSPDHTQPAPPQQVLLVSVCWLLTQRSDQVAQPVWVHMGCGGATTDHSRASVHLPASSDLVSQPVPSSDQQFPRLPQTNSTRPDLCTPYFPLLLPTPPPLPLIIRLTNWKSNYTHKSMCIYSDTQWL